MRKLVKKLYSTLSLSFIMSVALTSCSDFMDLTPEDQYDEATVWSDAGLFRLL